MLPRITILGEILNTWPHSETNNAPPLLDETYINTVNMLLQQLDQRLNSRKNSFVCHFNKVVKAEIVNWAPFLMRMTYLLGTMDAVVSVFIQGLSELHSVYP